MSSTELSSSTADVDTGGGVKDMMKQAKEKAKTLVQEKTKQAKELVQKAKDATKATAKKTTDAVKKTAAQAKDTISSTISTSTQPSKTTTETVAVSPNKGIGSFFKSFKKSSTSPSSQSPPTTQPTQSKFDLEPFIAFFFFLMAFIYVMADFFVIFDVNNYLGEWSGGATKFAVGYSFAIFVIIFKLLLVLFFIYLFIVFYKVTVIALVTPVLSNNVSSNESIDNSNGAREVIDKAKMGFSESLNYILKSNMKTVFGIYKIPNAIIGLLIVLPVFVYISTFSYYYSISRTKYIKDEDVQNVLTTNYHYFAIIILTILILYIMNIFYGVLVGN